MKKLLLLILVICFVCPKTKDFRKLLGAAKKNTEPTANVEDKFIFKSQYDIRRPTFRVTYTTEQLAKTKSKKIKIDGRKAQCSVDKKDKKLVTCQLPPLISLIPGKLKFTDGTNNENIYLVTYAFGLNGFCPKAGEKVPVQVNYPNDLKNSGLYLVGADEDVNIPDPEPEQEHIPDDY